jgi:hypothetical protein
MFRVNRPVAPLTPPARTLQSISESWTVRGALEGFSACVL